MMVRIKKLQDNAVIPSYATQGDAGLDLSSAEHTTLQPGGFKAVGTGIAMALPEGHVGLVHPRSGMAARHGVTVLNAPGTVDSGYRGEIKVLLINHGDQEFVINPGDRIAQMVIQGYAEVTLDVGDELPTSQRGEGGFGSTGV